MECLGRSGILVVFPYRERKAGRGGGGEREGGRGGGDWKFALVVGKQVYHSKMGMLAECVGCIFIPCFAFSHVLKTAGYLTCSLDLLGVLQSVCMFDLRSYLNICLWWFVGPKLTTSARLGTRRLPLRDMPSPRPRQQELLRSWIWSSA